MPKAGSFRLFLATVNAVGGLSSQALIWVPVTLGVRGLGRVWLALGGSCRAKGFDGSTLQKVLSLVGGSCFGFRASVRGKVRVPVSTRSGLLPGLCFLNSW